MSVVRDFAASSIAFSNLDKSKFLKKLYEDLIFRSDEHIRFSMIIRKRFSYNFASTGGLNFRQIFRCDVFYTGVDLHELI